MVGPPMVLFHSSEFTPDGLDTEFAIPVKEYATGTRDFNPGLCLKTVVQGAYSELTSVYAKQREWAEKEGFKCNNAPYEAYVTDPSQIENETDDCRMNIRKQATYCALSLLIEQIKKENL